MVNGTRKNPVYALGQSDRELERLSVQAKLFDPLTHQLLRDTGIAPGMRVLDVGSGSGDVSFLADRMRGEVVAGGGGCDAAARRRVVSQTSFKKRRYPAPGYASCVCDGVDLAPRVKACLILAASVCGE
jgi:hypothetical protein